MKIWTNSIYSLGVMLGIATSVCGQTSPVQAPMTSTTQSADTIQEMKSYGEPKKSQAPVIKQKLPDAVAPPSLFAREAEYLHPGILVNVNGNWEGSDHLLNISPNIGVYVTIIKPENEDLHITQNQLKKEIESIFKLADIKPVSLVPPGAPPLPAFQIEIFVYPIDKGYVACCAGRLFESVILDRFKLNSKMAFQAITWEKQHLMVSPKDQFAEQLTQIVRGIATTFGERYQVYERIKHSNF